MAPILVFDSGVGGLSIVDALRARLPALPLAFACDNAAFPYGTKSEAELLPRIEAVMQALLETIRPALVVVACNTASTLALPQLRERFDLPFVGVVPAIKPAAQASQTRIIGLLATRATIARPYTEQLIREFAADCTVIRQGASELVEAAEARLRGETPDPSVFHTALKPFLLEPEQRPDVIVLACTHFPLLRTELAAALPYPVRWLDSGEAIARRVESLLPTVTAAASVPALANSSWMTRQDEAATQLTAALAQRGLGAPRFLPV